MVLRHPHIATHGEGMPEIIDPGAATVILRKDEGGTIATAVLFEWCDGYQSTITDALSRTVPRQLDVTAISRQLSPLAEAQRTGLLKNGLLCQVMRKLELGSGN